MLLIVLNGWVHEVKMPHKKQLPFRINSTTFLHNL